MESAWTASRDFTNSWPGTAAWTLARGAEVVGTETDRRLSFPWNTATSLAGRVSSLLAIYFTTKPRACGLGFVCCVGPFSV